MAMAEEKKVVKTPHNVIMEDRTRLMVTGVNDVDSFDEQTVVLVTDQGELTVRGGDLHISRFNVETGELNMEGRILAMIYTDSQKQQGAFSAACFDDGPCGKSALRTRP